MTRMMSIEVKEHDPVRSLQALFRSMLESGGLEALLVPQHIPGGMSVMPALVTDPQRLSGADPLAPAFPLNAAKVVSKLTRKPIGAKVGAVLRPCEIRAFTELVKLKQGNVDDLVIIGVDCRGAYRNRDYQALAVMAGDEFSLKFQLGKGPGEEVPEGEPDISPACLACEYPEPVGADLTIGLFGADIRSRLLLIAQSERGEKLADKLGLEEATEPQERATEIARLKQTRSTYREQMFSDTAEKTSDLEKLSQYLSRCVNCYNCRVACPVCYCKECVFVTDVFEHEPSQYVRWARRKGMVKMPTDTLFFHLTRLAHMSTACVGCGQCSNACPNDIPVAQLFRTVSKRTQLAFGYEPGRSLDEPPPLSDFREKEFPEVTGGRP